MVVIAEITHLSKHDTVAEEGLAICPHMSSFVSIYDANSHGEVYLTAVERV